VGEKDEINQERQENDQRGIPDRTGANPSIETHSDKKEANHPRKKPTYKNGKEPRGEVGAADFLNTGASREKESQTQGSAEEKKTIHPSAR
jgi:hypothetical protein